MKRLWSIIKAGCRRQIQILVEAVLLLALSRDTYINGEYIIMQHTKTFYFCVRVMTQ